MVVKQRKGAILVSALIIISLCTTAAMFLHERSIASYGSVMRLQSEYQGAIYSMTIGEAVDMLFAYDDSAYDSEFDIWNTDITLPIDNGFITIYVKPLNAKFPMNALANDNETERERYEIAFESLMYSLDVTNYDIDALLSWVGVGDPYSDRLDENNGAYSRKSSSLETLAELAYLPEFASDYKSMASYISIGESGSKININLASEEVILAILPELDPYIVDIMSYREDSSFESISDLYTLMGEYSQDVYTTILPFIDVKSSLYYAKIEINILDEYMFYHILYSRSGSSASVVKYIEGGNIDYF